MKIVNTINSKAESRKLGEVQLWVVPIGQRYKGCWETIIPLSVRDFGLAPDRGKLDLPAECDLIIDRTKKDPRGNPRVKIIRATNRPDDRVLVLTEVDVGRYMANIESTENAEVLARGHDIYGRTQLMIVFYTKDGVVRLKTDRLNPPYRYVLVWDGKNVGIYPDHTYDLVRWADND